MVLASKFVTTYEKEISLQGEEIDDTWLVEKIG